ncbi:hypothetical protein JCM6882_002804 [Rhodosporidiobolus microsporus]
MATYEGHCLCGASRIEVRGPEAKTQDRCHCTDCQRTSGGPFASSITVAQSDASITGDQVARYEYKSAMGNDNVRIFCKGCGFVIQTGPLGKYASKLPFTEELFVKDRWDSIPAVPGANQRDAMY